MGIRRTQPKEKDCSPTQQPSSLRPLISGPDPASLVHVASGMSSLSLGVSNAHRKNTLHMKSNPQTHQQKPHGQETRPPPPPPQEKKAKAWRKRIGEMVAHPRPILLAMCQVLGSRRSILCPVQASASPPSLQADADTSAAAAARTAGPISTPTSTSLSTTASCSTATNSPTAAAYASRAPRSPVRASATMQPWSSPMPGVTANVANTTLPLPELPCFGSSSIISNGDDVNFKDKSGGNSSSRYSQMHQDASNGGVRSLMAHIDSIMCEIDGIEPKTVSSEPPLRNDLKLYSGHGHDHSAPLPPLPHSATGTGA